MLRRFALLFTAATACSGAADTPVERPAHARTWRIDRGAGESPCALGWGCGPEHLVADRAVAPAAETSVPAGEPPAPAPAPIGCGPAYVAFCDADGVTFYAPERCPHRPHVSAGACREAGEAVTERFSPEEAADPTRPQFRSTACTASDTCGRGRRCWGMEGCTTTWTCERVRNCPRETDQWCSCDGETFTASRACPGRPVRHRGPCEPLNAR